MSAAPDLESAGGWPRNGARGREVLIALLLLALSAVALHRTRDTRLDGRLGSDEPEWIAISILHWRQLVHGEPPAGADLPEARRELENPWKQGVQNTTFGYMNPCLPKLIWGAVFAAAGHREASPRAFLTFHRDDPAAGRAAQEQLLPVEPLARGVVLLLAAITGVLLFFCARELFVGRAGWVCGALALVLWLASPLVRATSTTIRTDYFMLPFCLGALLVALRHREALAGRRGRRALLGTALSLGLLAGLAVASKLNGGLVCVAIAIWVPVAWGRARAPDRPSFLQGPLPALALAGLVCVAVFLALNPRLWSEPIAGLQDVLARWERLMTYFREDWGPRTGIEVPHSTGERLTLFARKAFARDEPLGALSGLPILGGLAAAAGALALLRARRAATWIALAFALVFVAGTALWLPLDWDRLYLPALPALILLEAALAGALVERLGGAQRSRPDL